MLIDGVNTVISTQMTMGLTRAIGLPALPLRWLWQMVSGIAIPQTMQSMTSPIIVMQREARATAVDAAGGKDDDEAIEGSDDISGGGENDTSGGRRGGEG
jgi:hypothetical protein